MRLGETFEAKGVASIQRPVKTVAALDSDSGTQAVATRWVSTLLYDVSPTDPAVFTGLSIGLLVLAVGSCYLPARRAAHNDPLIALRAD